MSMSSSATTMSIIWQDDGKNCGNPPPPWAPANGWRRRCENHNTTIIITGGSGNNGDGMGMGWVTMIEPALRVRQQSVRPAVRSTGFAAAAGRLLRRDQSDPRAVDSRARTDRAAARHGIGDAACQRRLFCRVVRWLQAVRADQAILAATAGIDHARAAFDAACLVSAAGHRSEQQRRVLGSVHRFAAA